MPGLTETVVLSPPILGPPDEADRVASSVTYGFVLDLVAVEIDRATGAIRIDKYVSAHDVGTMLNPLIVEGQIHGGFAHGLGAALFEELAYDADGQFLSGTFADYLCPTAPEMPPLDIVHLSTPSPRNPLGAKGMGDGSAMLTPAALANAVADALGRDDIDLPLTLNRVWELANPELAAAPAPEAAPEAPGGGGLSGTGEVTLPAPRDTVWRKLTEPNELARLIPGCERLEAIADDHYRAVVTIGVAMIRGRYETAIELHDKEPPLRFRLKGKAEGALGFGSGDAVVTLDPTEHGGTRLAYRYEARIGGKLAAVGQRLLDTAARLLIAQFFRGLAADLGPPVRPGLVVRLGARLRARLR
jgi:2-furoyl-CoA dehydrogenase large subunit